MSRFSGDPPRRGTQQRWARARMNKWTQSCPGARGQRRLRQESNPPWILKQDSPPETWTPCQPETWVPLKMNMCPATNNPQGLKSPACHFQTPCSELMVCRQHLTIPSRTPKSSPVPAPHSSWVVPESPLHAANPQGSRTPARKSEAAVGEGVGGLLLRPWLLPELGLSSPSQVNREPPKGRGAEACSPLRVPVLTLAPGPPLEPLFRLPWKRRKPGADTGHLVRPRGLPGLFLL